VGRPKRTNRWSGGATAIAVLVALGILAANSVAAKPGGGDGGKADHQQPLLKTAVTGRRAELRPTVPIASRAGGKTKSVLSVQLPRLRTGERVRFNGEVTITLTCVEQISRCIGDSYRFDPHLRARIVLADEAGQAGKGTVPVSRWASLTCQQTRPNRNHHCPLTVEGGSFTVKELRDLPCKPSGCRLNMAFDAYHHKARDNEFVVVGADQPDGSVEGGKARLSAAVSLGRVEEEKRETKHRLHKSIPASFDGGKTVVYSQRLDNLQAGDVLLVRSKQRTAIRGLPYFLSNQILLSTRPNASKPSRVARRSFSRSGLATETTGFNCTLGHSAFQSPCVSIKAGMATVESVPKTGKGRPRPVYVNVVSRGFPKLAQARGYPPSRVLEGGSLIVRRLRLAEEPKGGGGLG
jgi:hypothetical protein